MHPIAICAEDSSYAKSIKFCTLLGFLESSSNVIEVKS